MTCEGHIRAQPRPLNLPPTSLHAVRRVRRRISFTCFSADCGPAFCLIFACLFGLR